MNYSFNNLFANHNQNVYISNSLILNHYSIRNLFFSSSCLNNYVQMEKNENIFDSNNIDQISFFPVSKKVGIKDKFRMPKEQSNILKNITPIPNIKNGNRINNMNLTNIPNTHRNKAQIPKIIPIKKFIKENEKNPQDSKKKLIKKNKIYVRKANNKKLINSSISSRVLQTIKSISLNLYNESSIQRDSHSKIKKLSKKKKISKNAKNTKNIDFQPKEKLNLKDFQFGEQIGNGTFGKIFSVKWVINNQNYAMKKEILNDIEDIKKRKDNFKIIQNFMKETGCKGVIHLYGNLCFKKNKLKSNNEENKNNTNNTNEFIYYELMEKAEKDWDKEINIRAQNKLYYTENELLNIMTQLITTLSLLEKNHITHRDIKPQNILIINGQYKLGDFGEIRVLERNGLVVQRVRGSELYMSPILFHGLHVHSLQVKHNTYKSDVFSLGMCLFYAASLTYIGVDSIRELTDIIEIKNIIFQFLSKIYSEKLINFILSMLEVNENKRKNFIQLEEKLKKKFNYSFK